MDLAALRRAWRGGLPDVPVEGADDTRWSAVSSATDLYVRPTDELVEILLGAAQRARSLDLSTLQERCPADVARWIGLWPGEHYRLLAGLTELVQPAQVVEIGTFEGHGALALAAGHPRTTVVTYDIVDWTDFPGTALRAEDFDSGRIEQRLGDLGDPAYLDSQEDTLRAADLVFVDGPKDGRWEQHALAPLLARLTDRRRLVVLDDTRLLAMLQIWRDLPYPKLDATSLGHWSGTGLLHTT